MTTEDRIREALRHRAAAVTTRSRWDEIDGAQPVPGRPPEPRRSRIAAAVVAFAVFVPVAVVGWVALRETEAPAPPTSPVETGVAVVTLAESGPPGHQPSGHIVFGDRRVRVPFGSYGWSDGNVSTIADVFGPSLDRFIELPVGTELVVDSDAVTLEGYVAEPETLRRTDALPLDDRRVVLTLDPGRHVLALTAHWAYDDVSVDVPFYVPIELVDPASPEGGLQAAMFAPADGSMPELTLSIGESTETFFAQSGEWPGVGGFPLPLLIFEPTLPPGVELSIEGDATSVEGELEVLDEEVRGTGETIPLDVAGGSATLPDDPGSYELTLTGTWDRGTAGFHVVITVGEPESSRAAIEVTTPVNGDDVSPPVTISGTADVFEGNVRIRIFDSVNNMIVDTYTTATCGSGCRGDFSAEIEFAVAEEQLGEIVVFEESAETGKPTNVVRIPVTLLPGENVERAAEFVGTWTSASGNVVPDDIVRSTLGVEHCSMGDIVFLHVGDAPYATGPMTFVRDTTGELETVTRPWASLPSLPDGLEASGWRIGDWELWFDPSDLWSVYLHNASTRVTERWPTLREQVGCF